MGLWRGSSAVVAALAVLVLVGCGSGSDGGAGARDGESAGSPAGATKVVVALASDPTTLDPQLADDGSERLVNDSIYDMLLTRDADGKLQPSLATALPEQRNTTTWRFKLRTGVKFSNDEP